MARRAFGPATAQLVQAIARADVGPAMIACSGGADSLALAAATVLHHRPRQVEVRAVIVDHQLQQNSGAIADQAAGQLQQLGIPAVIVRVTVADSHDGPEAAARRARYQALTGQRQLGESVLLGHTLDDQAETVLLGLMRGSGTRSLAGIPARRGFFVRPFLGVRAAITRQACRELGLTWWEDPHNEDVRFTRVRIRRRVLPFLETELGPGITEALARTAAMTADDADLLDDLAAAAWDHIVTENPRAPETGPRLSCTALAAQPPALRSRIVRRWLIASGSAEVSYRHVHAVLGLVTNWHGQGPIMCPGVRVWRRDGYLVVQASLDRPETG